MGILHVGIVGCGLIGNKRARVVRDDPKSSLCCTADVNGVSAAALIKEFGDGSGKAYHDWKEMLDKEYLGAVIIATPNKYLKEITLRAAQRNIHVLCEKPLGRNAWESERIVEGAKENEVILKTGFNHRHHPVIFKAHQLVEDGAIGEVYFARCTYGHGGRPGYEKEWRASKDICGGGELLDQGVHVVDLFRWFIGDFEEAFGHVPTFYWNMEVEDNAFAMFKTAKGQIASMHTSWTQWKNRFTFEVYGEAGYLIVDGLGGSYGVETLTIGRRQRAEIGGQRSEIRDRRAEVRGQEKREGCNSYSLLVNRESKQENLSDSRITNQRITNNSALRYAGGVPQEETIVFDGQDVSWEEEWKEFVMAIREGREPMGNGQDGLEANRMIDAVYRSARENRSVKIKEKNKR